MSQRFLVSNIFILSFSLHSFGHESLNLSAFFPVVNKRKQKNNSNNSFNPNPSLSLNLNPDPNPNTDFNSNPDSNYNRP